MSPENKPSINQGQETDWSEEAQAARQTKGIKRIHLNKEQRQQIAQMLIEWQQTIIQDNEELRETEYPIATGEALHRSVDI